MRCILKSVHLQSPCAIQRENKNRKEYISMCHKQSSSPCISKHRVFDLIPIVSLSFFFPFFLNRESGLN